MCDGSANVHMTKDNRHRQKQHRKPEFAAATSYSCSKGEPSSPAQRKVISALRVYRQDGVCTHTSARTSTMLCHTEALTMVTCLDKEGVLQMGRVNATLHSVQN
jgi:hypothetical protein